MKKVVNKTIYEFRFIPVLIYLVFLIMLVSLGFWQLGRAEEKKVFLIKEQHSATKDVIKLSTNTVIDPEELRYRKTELTGKYDQKHQFLIDNQIINGKAGYFVLTPFKIDGMNKAVLVNRGWVTLNKDRRVLPEIAIALIETTLSGTINNFPSVGIRLKGAEIPTDGWPSVVQVVDIDILSKKTGYSLLPFQIELDADIRDGYIRDWKKRTSISPEKHTAYAVQWFALAITLTILFIRLNRKVI
jgi:surfeit locus 1 family protein